MLAAAVLGAVLTGCGTGSPGPGSGAGSGEGSGTEARRSPSAPVPSTSATAPPSPTPVPTVAAGPGGLTPVFERARKSAGGEKVVALTFDADMTADQGPRAARGEHFDNPELIASLRKWKVPSTVFMTGRWAEEYPDQARSIGTDPLFEIANHSYSHHAFSSPCYGLPTVEPKAMKADVDRAFAAFAKAGATNVVPYFRFPGGCYDDRALRSLGPAKVTAVQWDVVSGDAFATNADAVAEQVLAGVKPGSLVVMHCTRSAAPTTEKALRRVVPELRKRGYRFVKVSDLIARR
ncbi:lipoprotein [Streptomyces spiroverticillatus]|uniref:Lipoprotein n=1 Tax=Streptomyces finlayi TaxID=67296 RepID=A0A919C9H1_9ACTN|nr:polysaccharide deacetylase family protein [Streptomyces finlayi]GHA02882.1 lipoprotein [Streptomyces spiroverticillatus]GHC87114.1 lipoprotein [Streptomyces finlayi]